MTCRLIHLCSLFCLASWAWLPGAVAAPGDAQGGAVGAAGNHPRYLDGHSPASLPGRDQPVPVRPVHRVSLRADAVDVRRKGLRRQFRGRAAVPRRVPQGDRPARAAVVSRRRGAPRRVRAGPRPIRSTARSRSASRQKPGDPVHAGHLARRQVRQGRRAAAVLAVPARRRSCSIPVRVALWGQGKTYAAAEFQPDRAVAAIRGDARRPPTPTPTPR